MDFFGDDGYDAYGRRRRRPSPHQMRSDYLTPQPGGGGLYRSRSQGHGPAPTINVYNRNENDQGSPYPPYLPYPTASGSRRASPRSSPEGRGRDRSRLGARLGDEFIFDELADIALEHRYRSRSRGRSDASAFDRPPEGRTERQLEKQLRDMSLESRRRDDEENLRRRWRLEQMEEEAKKKREEEERERREGEIRADMDRKAREAKEKEKAARIEWERKNAEEEQERKDEEQKIRDRIAKEAQEKKAKEKAAYEEFKRKEKEQEEEEKRQWEEFERKRKEKEAKEKQKKADEEKAFQEEMRKRLRLLGYTEETIEVMVDQEKTKKFKEQVNRPTGDQMDIYRAPRAPVYPKVHKSYLAVETLKYYDLPWEYDRHNPDYIIILRDMDKKETDLLFEHTTRLRSGKLLLEPPERKKPEYAFYRKRSRSRGAPKQDIYITPIFKR